jgi:molybdate transport system regulatory protein
MHRPRIRLLIGAAVALGPGKAALLEAISRTGSISAAAREMGMSYRRAWSLVDRMNAKFIGPLVEKTAGGRGGGGAQLSALGSDVLQRYHAIENKAAKSVEADMEDFAPLLRDQE